MDQANIIQIGFIVVFIGMIIIASSILFTQNAKSDNKFSVFGIFGFIPFGFSNDKRLFLLSVVLTVIIIASSFLFFYKRIR